MAQTKSSENQHNIGKVIEHAALGVFLVWAGAVALEGLGVEFSL